MPMGDENMTANIQLVWTFMLDYTRGWGVRRHDHDYFQMYFCLAGEGAFFLDGKDLVLQKEDCLIIRPNQVHELYPISNGQFRIIDTKFYIRDDDLYQSILDMPSLIRISTAPFGSCSRNMRGEWASGAPYSKADGPPFSLSSPCTFTFVTARPCPQTSPSITRWSSGSHN